MTTFLAVLALLAALGVIAVAVSSIDDAITLAAMVGASALVPSHHDPTHSDAELDTTFRSARGAKVELTPAAEGLTLSI